MDAVTRHFYRFLTNLYVCLQQCNELNPHAIRVMNHGLN